MLGPAVKLVPSYSKDTLVSPAAIRPAVKIPAPADVVLSVPDGRVPPDVQLVPSYSKDVVKLAVVETPPATTPAV